MEIAEFPAFAHLNATQLANLAAAGESLELPSGSEIITAGKFGGKLFFLLDGTLEVLLPNQKNGKLIELSAPAVVGEIELLIDELPNATVRTATPARLLGFPHDRVRERIADGDPAVLKVMHGISIQLAGRLAHLTRQFSEFLDSPPERRSAELKSFQQKLFCDWSF